MKIGLLTCVHRRYSLARLTMEANLVAALRAGLEVVTPYVIAEDETEACGWIEEWERVLAPNSPLSNRWNAGVAAFRDTGIDALMILGSDDLVSATMFTEFKKSFESPEGSLSLYGLTSAHILHGPSGRVRKFPGYTGERAGEAIGTCRLFPRWALEHVNWKLWPDDLAAGLDAACAYKHFTPIDQFSGFSPDAVVLDVKANPTVDMGNYFTMEGSELPEGFEFVRRHFPEIADELWVVTRPLATAERVFHPVMKPFLSACLMVRNEADGIGEALASLDGLADEVLVLDTGSTDETPEIAEAYGAIVTRVTADLPFDFGKYRNESIQKARGDWVLILDGDEWVADAGNLLELLRALPAEANMVAAPHVLLGGKEAEGRSVIARCLRGDDVRSGKLYYEYPIHHQIRGVTNFTVAESFLTEEPWFDFTESARRAIPTLEKLLTLSTAPSLVGANGKALGGKKNDREHALLYLARSYAMLGSEAKSRSDAALAAAVAEGKEGTADPSVREARIAFEKASLFASELVDTDPGRLDGWLVLLACVEASRSLLACEPIALKALTYHSRSIDLRWWWARISVAAIAVLSVDRNQYPLVPSRSPHFLPHIRDVERFLGMKFPSAVK